VGRDVSTVRLATEISVSYVEQGDRSGIPVLLVHAWGESKGSFDRLLPELPASLRVLAFDQRGHGDSDKPASGYELSTVASDVEAFMEVMGVESAVLCGSSSGGYVAQQVAVQVPSRVNALVLVGAPRTLQGAPAFADEVMGLTDPIDPQWVRDSLNWFPRFHPIPDWYIEDRIADGLQMPARAWKGALSGLASATPPTESGKITCPTLVIWGARDELLGRGDEEQLAAAIPKSRLSVYEDTGHLVLWEQPERVAMDLLRFIEELHV
jgi:rifampin ADP-ribosylating transferase